MRVVVFGATGQVGRSLADTQPESVDAIYISRKECDLADDRAIENSLDKHSPGYVINAAAYTQVDKAESEPEKAFQINAGAPQKMAMWVRDHDAKLIHISTDFVFSGNKEVPYLPEDDPHPLGVYGQSKLLGENVARGFSNQQAMIIRTSWVYSEHGSNFVKTMLRLMAEKDELSVVSDQQGSPTYARDLAAVLWKIVTGEGFDPGIYHWTDAGDISWCEFAMAIQEEAIAADLLERSIPVKPIPTEQYPTPASRPAYSVLACEKLAAQLNLEPSPWRQNLKQMLAKLAEAS